MKNFFSIIWKWIGNNKNGILTSIIAAGLFSLLPKIIDLLAWIGDTIIYLLSNLNQSSVDYYYASIVKNIPGDIFIYINFAFLILLIIKLNFESHYILTSNLKRVSSVLDYLIEGKKDEIKSKEILNRINSDSSLLLKKRIASFRLNFFLIASGLLLLGSILISAKNNKEDFNNTLTKLSGYFAEQTINRLKSEWLEINSKADYDTLHAKVQRYLDEVEKMKKEGN